ncbi:MAG: hypothetical protein GC157_06525 [Frankiales bacterium]|nr:hypothetical protein [Frankiales bacterium]
MTAVRTARSGRRPLLVGAVMAGPVLALCAPSAATAHAATTRPSPLAAPPATSAPPVGGRVAPSAVSPARWCSSPLAAARSWGNTASDLAAGRVRILGRAATVDLRHLDLTTPPAAFREDTRAMWWRSLTWVVPLFVPEDRGGSRIADQLAQAVHRVADPGSATASALDRSYAVGWAEGTNTRREQALDCLVAVTRSASLTGELRRTVAANLDPRRYYGPPAYPVHNHGTMANLALLDSAALLGSPKWAATAVSRLRAELPGAFSPAGFTGEQSTAYHEFNRVLWQTVRTRLAGVPGGSVVGRAVGSMLVRAARMSAHLTSPTGARIPIGDGFVSTSAPPPPQRYLAVTDRVGGVLARRWSWRDPATTYWTQRLGDSFFSHGHYDWGSVTWGTRGVAVLVDPGGSANDRHDAVATWLHSPSGHNIAVPQSARLGTGGAVLRSIGRSGRVDTSVVDSRLFTTRGVRTVRVDDARHRLVIVDEMAGSFTSHVHLDPVWRPTWRTARSLGFTDGRHRLTVSVSPGSSARILVRSTSPVGGWVLPRPGVALGAVEILVPSHDRLTTTLTVT